MAWDHQDIESPKLDVALSNQLTAEFGAHGKRAVASLETAQRLLDLEAGLLPRHGETVAYCVRVALDEIPKAAETGNPGRWGSLSRAAVQAANQYKVALNLKSDEEQVAGQVMFARIDELQAFHEHDDGIHQERLKELFRQRTGTEPLSSGTTPLREYQSPVQRLQSRCA